MSNENEWPDMEKVCRQCAKLGTGPDATLVKCTNTNSSRYDEPVGYWGTGCESFVYPKRFKKETQDIRGF